MTSMNRKQRRKLRKTVEELESYSDHDAWICGLKTRRRRALLSRSRFLESTTCVMSMVLNKGASYDLMLGDDLLDRHVQRRIL